MQTSSESGGEVRPLRARGRLTAVLLALIAAGCGGPVDEPRSAGSDRDAAADGAVGVSKSALSLDNAQVTPVAAYSLALKLRAAYAGVALRVRRASDSAHAEIGFTGASRVDGSAIATFCGSSDGFLAALYDQSGNAQDLTQTHIPGQIKIYDGATRTLVGGGSTPLISVTSPGMAVVRGGTLGLSGNPAFTIAYSGRYFRGVTGQNEITPILIAGVTSTTNNTIGFGFGEPVMGPYVFSGGGHSGWARTGGESQTHRGVLRHAAGAPMSASTFRFNGVDLGATIGGNNDSLPFEITPSFTMLGKSPSNNNDSGAELSTVLIWNTVLGESDLAIVDQLLAASATPLSSSACYGAPGTQALAPWPMVGLCPMHRGQSPTLAAQTNTQRWVAQIGSGAARGAAVIAADGTIYAPSTGRLAALNPATGAQLWQASARSPGSSPAIGSDGTVYSISSFNSLEARNPGTGSLKWSFGLDSIASTGPAIGRDGTIYVSSQNGRLSALSPTGSARWTVTKGAITTSPAIGVDGVIYVGADNGLHAVNPDGSARWTAAFGAGAFVRSSPAIASDGTIYVGTDTSKLVAVNPNGTTRWTFSAAGIVRSSPAVASDGTIYFGARNGLVYALNPGGTQKWTRSTGASVDSSPAIGSDGTIYIGSDNGRLYALRPADGTIKFQVNTPNAIRSPITIGRDGTVYAGAEDARLFAIGPGTCAASDTTCDAKDDNCNGALDEGFVNATSSCGVGACARSAALSCVDGTLLGGGCAPGTPGASDTTCNALDENCSGQNDEGYVSQATSCGVGACARTGATSCASGAVQDSCLAASPPSTSDATCDQVDDNCNGIVDDLCGINLVVNGTFETGVAPNQGLKPSGSQIVAAPEFIGWETTDTNGTAGALRVTMTRDVQAGLNFHNTGPFISLAPTVPVGTWLHVTFRAKSLSGQTLMSILRSWGGSSAARLRITTSWATHHAYLQVGQETSALIFNLVSNDVESIQPVDTGVFLLDDIDVRVVAPCSSTTSCGSYSPDAIFASSLIELWDGRFLVAFDGVTSQATSWTGLKRGTVLSAPSAAGRPIYGQQPALNGSNAIITYRQTPSYLSASLGQDLIASGSRPYIALVYHLRTSIAQAGSAGSMLELRASSDGSGPMLAMSAVPDAGGAATTRVAYAPNAANPTLFSSSAAYSATATLAEFWLAADGLHYAHNGVERPVDSGASAALSQGLRHIFVGNDPGVTQGSDTSYGQILVASAVPSAAQRAAYQSYARKTWGVGVGGCSSQTGCVNADFCCPQGCNGFNDSDCASNPGGGCSSVQACTSGDFCCPVGCDVSGDADCGNTAPCGNVQSCTGGDGCCPAGCEATDGDCPPCGPVCSVPGEPDGCGGTCAACTPGADSDQDATSDCEEAWDADPLTDPNAFNGVQGQRGPSCYPDPTCADIDTLAEIRSCFSASEDKRLTAGWDFSTADRNACDPGFGFQPGWSVCGEDFAVDYSGNVRFEQSGTHCFRLAGGTSDQCAALYFDGALLATTASGVQCVTREAGSYPIEWFYQSTNDTLNEHRLQYCAGGATSCTPSSALPARQLSPTTRPSECSAACDRACESSCTPSTAAQCASTCVDGQECARRDAICDAGGPFCAPACTCEQRCPVPEQQVCDSCSLFQCGSARFASCVLRDEQCPDCPPDPTGGPGVCHCPYWQCGAQRFDGSGACQQVSAQDCTLCGSHSECPEPIELDCQPAGCTVVPDPNCIAQSACAGIGQCAACFGCKQTCESSQCPAVCPDRTLTPDAACTEECPCDSGATCTSDLQCARDLSCRTDMSARFGRPAGTGVCWDPRCDDIHSAQFECGATTSLCGSCPACAASCAGKQCGSDGCWGSCGDECDAGEQGCDSTRDCAQGLVCLPSASGLHSCLPAQCGIAGKNPCSDPANAGQQTVCGLCPACAPDCAGRACGPAPNGCGQCGSSTLSPSQYCSNDGTIEPAVQDAFGVLPTESLDDGPDTPGNLPGTFAVSDFGQATYALPLPLPPGRNGLEPKLSLVYNSDAGNNYLGAGWSLEGLSAIQRCPRTIAQDGAPGPITYTQSDRFCLDGKRLVTESGEYTYGGNNVRYRTEIESFERVISYVSAGSPEPTRFEVLTPEGNKLTYDQPIAGGRPRTAGIDDPDDDDVEDSSIRTQSWLLTRAEDRFGNSLRVRYEVPPARARGLFGTLLAPAQTLLSIFGGPAREYYPRFIEYTSHEDAASDRQVELVYRDRHDVLTGYRAGVRHERTRLLERIVARVQNREIFVYKLDYDEPASDALGDVPDAQLHLRSRLLSVTQCARSALDSATAGTCKPPTAFTYETVTPGFGPVIDSVANDYDNPAEVDAGFVGSPITLDIDGNGKDDVVYSQCTEFDQGLCVDMEWRLILNGQAVSSGQYFNKQRTLSNTPFHPHAITPATVFVMDYDLDGRDDLIEVDAANRTAHDGHLRRWSMVNGQFRSENLDVTLAMNRTVSGGAVYPIDANGDGAIDLVSCSPVYSPPGPRSTPPKLLDNEWHLYLHDGLGGLSPRERIAGVNIACYAGNGVDLNGDGAQELLLNTTPYGVIAGSDRNKYWKPNDASAALWPLTGELIETALPAGKRDRTRLVLDVNGDTLTDVVELTDQYEVVTWLNTGNGFVSRDQKISFAQIAAVPYPGPAFVAQAALFAVPFDENSDGRTDLLLRATDTFWMLLRSRGSSFAVLPLPNDFELPHGGSRFFVYDADHDGLRDLVAPREGNAFRANLRRGLGASSPRLLSVTDGLGEQITVEYDHGPFDGDGVYAKSARACSFPRMCPVPRSALVKAHSLYRRVLVNGAEVYTPRRYEYRYVGFARDMLGRGALGFENRVIADPAHGQTFLEYDSVTQYEPLSLYPYAGRVMVSVDVSLLPNERARTVELRRTWKQDLVENTPGAVFPYAERETTTVREGALGGSGTLLSSVERAFGYDPYGNLESLTTTWKDGETTSAATRVDTSYELDEDHVEAWLVRQPRTVEVRDAQSGSLERTVGYAYPEDLGEPGLNFSGKPSRIVRGGRDAPSLSTALQYDLYGNVERVEASGATIDGPRTRTTLVRYGDLHLFPTEVEDSNGHVEYVHYDQGLGVPLERHGEGRPGVELISHSIPDGFGRTRRVVGPDGVPTDTEYLAQSGGGLIARTLRPGAPSQTVSFDPSGRVSRREMDGFDRTLIAETSYDLLGLPARMSRPHAAGVDPDYSFTLNDAQGRPVRTDVPGNRVIEHCYRDHVSCQRNPRGHTACEISDARGLVLYAVQPLDENARACNAVVQDVAQNFPVGQAPVANTGYRFTRYQYDAFGQLVAMTDPSLVSSEYQRDGLGRLRQQSDPDSGVWLASYNAFSELEIETNPDPRSSQYRYDLLGRLVSRTDLPGGEQTRWIWDRDPEDPALDPFYGRVLETITPDGVQSRQGYNDVGQLTIATQTIPAETGTAVLARHQTYDGNGRPASVSYDSVNGGSISFNYGYNTRGYLDRAFRPAFAGAPELNYWRAVEGDAYGQLLHERFGDNGAHTFFTYRAGTGELDVQRTEGNGADLVHWKHEYDLNGNLEYRRDQLTSGQRYTHYGYDRLDRLVSAERNLTTATPSLRQSEVYAYDAAGNIDWRDELDADAGTSAHWDYDYLTGNDGSGGPHALKRITRTGDGAFARYDYDARGNMRLRVSGGLQSALELAYDRQSFVTSLGSAQGASDSVAQARDASGQRVRKLAPTTETLYLDGGYSRERVRSTSGWVERLVITAGGRPVAEVLRDAASFEAVSYLHGDQLGSIELVTGPQGQLAEQRVYEAYGKRRSRTGPGAVTRGDYAGHELDSEFGLIHMKARFYDPVIGRFLAPDPLAGPMRLPLQPSPYAYAANNPVNMIDPLGLNPAVAAAPAAALAASAAPAAEGLTLAAVGATLGGLAAVGALAVACWGISELISDILEEDPPARMGAVTFDAGSEQSASPSGKGGRSAGGKGGKGKSSLAFPPPEQEQKPASSERKVNIWQVVKDEQKRPIVDIDLLNRAPDGSTSVSTTEAVINDINPLSVIEHWFDPDIPFEQKFVETSMMALGPLGGMLGTAVTRGAAAAARFNPARAGHIFRDALGHVNPASAGSQSRFARLFELVASNPANHRTDAVAAQIITQDAASAGVQAFTAVAKSGDQIWVVVRNGEIQNAGVNLAGALR